MKKYIKYFVLLLISVIALVSCSKTGNNQTTTNPTTSDIVTEYNIRFLQDDNLTVIKEMKVKAGEEIKYDGDTPVKISDSEYNYTFKEWNPKLATATKDQDFVAVYDKTPISPTYEAKYKVDLAFDDTKGTVTTNTSLTDISSGTKVIFTVTPKEGYKYEALKLNDQLADILLVDSKFDLIVYSNVKIEVLFTDASNPDTPVTEDIKVFDVDTYCVNNRIAKSDKVSTIKAGNITMSTSRGTNNGKMYPKDNYNNFSTWRLYGKENGKITITSSTKNILNIIVYCLDDNNDEGSIYLEDGTQYTSGDEIEVNGKTITLFSDGTQTRIYKIEFTYEGEEVTEYSIENAIKNYIEDNNYKVIFKLSGTGDLADDPTYNYQLVESYDNGKIKVVEKYNYLGEAYEDTNYFYYDKDGVFHMIYLNIDDEEDYEDFNWDDYDDIDWDSFELKKKMNAEDDTYTDIAETNSEYESIASYYTYFTDYKFDAFKVDDLEKVSANTYKVKADKIESISKAIFGDLSYGSSSDEFNYTYEVNEKITEIVIKIKEDRFQSITFKSNYSYIMDNEEADENGETHYEYSGTLTYSFKFSEFGKQEVTLPKATKYVTKVSVAAAFDLEDGAELAFDELYVNGVNTLEKLVFVCDDNGSIAVSIKNITLEEMPKVGAIVSLEGKISKTGNLVIIDATSMNVDNNDLASMKNLDIDTLDGKDYTFAGETVNYNYLTMKTKDIDNLDVSFEDLGGDTYKLSFTEDEKEIVTELFKQIDVTSAILFKNVAIMVEDDAFVITLMDHATYEVIEGLALQSNMLIVDSNISLEDACKDIVLYSFDNGIRSVAPYDDIKFTSTEYDSARPGTYLVTATYNSKSINLYIRVNLSNSIDAFTETAGKGIAYASERYNVPYGLASTTPEGKETLDILVIPVSFNNQTVPTNYKELLEKGFNGTSADTGWESFASYYEKSSYGKLKFHANIMDVYNTGDPYYKSEKTVGNKVYPDDYLDGYSALDLKYLDKAVAHYNDVIDYNDYDSNKDGYIDCVYLVYLAPYSTDDDALDYWWAYNNKTYDEIETKYDGLAFDTYMWFSYEFFNEKIDGHDEVKVNAETVIHESGHALGLDDYYDTEYSGNGGLGSGFMMDANVGDHDPYSKALLGWITPTIVIDKDVTIDISSFEETGDAIFITKDYNGIYYNEFFMIDYYTPTGLNELEAGNFGLPTIEGVRIYHVNAVPKENESQILSIWDITNTNNSNGANKLISIVEADGNDSILEGNPMSDSDLWQANEVASEFKWADGTECNFMIEVSKIENGKATISIVFVNQD